MKSIQLTHFIYILFMLLSISCGGSKGLIHDVEETKNEEMKGEGVINPVMNLTAHQTDKANELKISWNNPANTTFVKVSYLQEGADNKIHTISPNVLTEGKSMGTYVIKLPNYATFQIMVVAMDGYGNQSEKITITATPAKDDAAVAYEVVENKLPIADPYILYHDGKYYAYGTRINGFEVYISEDLKHWKKSEYLALSPENSWGTRWYWAPEVYYVESKNRFYMFYTVDEHICVASANTPTGPFIQDQKTPLIANEKAIDPSLFIDQDGVAYLYFVRFTGGNVIWVAEMNDDLKSIKTNTLTKCIAAEVPWEKIQGTIAEGPSILKIKDIYYLMYSANHFESKDYGVGYATASSPKGPWKKYTGNPILRRDMPAASGLIGTGHGAPFVSADGSYKYIYHAHADNNNVGPRRSYINDLDISEQGVISITGEAIRPVVVK